MKTPFRDPVKPQGSVQGRIAMDWCIDFALMFAIVATMLHPMWLVLPLVCLVLLWLGVLSL